MSSTIRSAKSELSWIDMKLSAVKDFPCTYILQHKSRERESVFDCNQWEKGMEGQNWRQVPWKQARLTFCGVMEMWRVNGNRNEWPQRSMKDIKSHSLEKSRYTIGLLTQWWPCNRRKVKKEAMTERNDVVRLLICLQGEFYIIANAFMLTSDWNHKERNKTNRQDERERLVCERYSFEVRCSYCPSTKSHCNGNRG